MATALDKANNDALLRTARLAGLGVSWLAATGQFAGRFALSDVGFVGLNGLAFATDGPDEAIFLWPRGCGARGTMQPDSQCQVCDGADGLNIPSCSNPSGAWPAAICSAVFWSAPLPTRSSR